MFNTVAIVGPGFKAPTYEELQGLIVQVGKDDINTRLEELRKSWRPLLKLGLEFDPARFKTFACIQCQQYMYKCISFKSSTA